MRVKSIVLDGFKSYAHRQELSDLDRHFNAITGFNGSGKSNVFDAICFVMGISNLKKVRAEDTRDLIYRAGAAGVQSARVTIEFLNDDASTAPAGYPPSEFPIITIGRQTQIGGKQRYFFMDRQSDQAKIKHFFQNINLNVDNPHFMVLQGTVHKLIGMKSSDILGLVEEAVGTKVFDLRRRTAENLIRSKERRLEDINRTLMHEIGPMLEAMRADQLEYDQFLKAAELLDTKRRFRTAFQFWATSTELRRCTAQKETLDRDITTGKTNLAEIPKLMEAQAKLVVELKQRLKEPEEEYMRLHEEEGETRKELQRIGVQLASAEKTTAEYAKLQKTYTAEAAELEKRRTALKRTTTQREDWKKALATATESMEQTDDSLRLLRSGVQAGLGGRSVEEERSYIEKQLIRIQGDTRRNKDRAEGLTVQVEELRKRMKGELQKVEALQKQVDQGKARLQAATVAFQPFEAAESRLRQLTQEISRKQKEIHGMQLELAQTADAQLPVAFHHDAIPGEPDMHARLYGRLGQLVHPTDAKYSVALSVGAQQHLMKMVIRDDASAQLLLERGGLRQRTSFLPMNRIQAPRVDAQRVHEAKRRAQDMGGFATLAKDLIRSDAQFAPVVEAMFGGFLICSSLPIAKVVAFDPAIAMKAVTLDGESVDPQGLMSGGSVTESMDLIARIHQQSARLQPLTALHAELRQLEDEQRLLSTRVGQGAAAKLDLENAEDALHRLEMQLKAVSGDTGEQLRGVEQELEETLKRQPQLASELADLHRRKGELEAHASMDTSQKVAELEARRAEFAKKVHQMQEKLAAGASDYDQQEAILEQRESELQTKTGDLERDMEQHARSRDAIKETQQSLEAKLKDIGFRRKESDRQRVQLEREIEDADNDAKSLRDRQDHLERSLKEKDAEHKQLHKAVEDHKKHLVDMEKKHQWLREEKAQFGPLGGPYPFEDVEGTKKTLLEIEEAESLSEKMSRRVNKKSTVLYEGIKKEYDELMDKRATLDEDRQAILEVMEHVESRKWAALDKMVHTVSEMFSVLFSACLPGAAARLVEERNDHGHICGLQVRVSFNGKEKESLTELSGGQRSLLALCLILAILRLKPAPIYILDEVDAALDPSHTQNIGRMLQQHFSHSQFLLVSLKDGMFNHANVLFEVRNTQGYSEITRKEAANRK